MSKFKVGDVVEYFPGHFYGNRTGVYIGTVVNVNESSEYCEVNYTCINEDGGIDDWIDLEPFCNIVKLTKLELALK